MKDQEFILLKFFLSLLLTVKESHVLSSSLSLSICGCVVNTFRVRQNGRHFADNIFKCIFLNKNVWIRFKISLKFVTRGPINNIPALVQIMAWRRSGDKPLSEPMMVQFTDAYMHHLDSVCKTRYHGRTMTRSYHRSYLSWSDCTIDAPTHW